MARIFTESFEGSHLLQWLTGNDYAVAGGGGLDGSTYKGYCSGGGRYGEFPLPSAVSEFYLGMYFNSTALNTSIPVGWMSDGTLLGYVYADNTTKELSVLIGAQSYGSGIILSGSRTYHLQVHVVIGDTLSGVLQVRLDDTLVIDQQPIDTQPGSETTVNRFRIGQDGGAAYTDSIVVNDTTGSEDNSWPGITRFMAKVISGPGYYVNNWSRNTGSTNYEAVDDIPQDSDTTYLYTSSASLYESFSVNDPLLTLANVRALRTMAVVKKDTGTVKLALGIRNTGNSTDYFSEAQDVGVSYGMLQDRRTLDPSTSLSWDQASLGALQALIISSE